MEPNLTNAAWNQVNNAVTKGTKQVLDKGRQVALAAAINAIPTGKFASEVGKFASKTTAGKMVATEAKTVVRKFTQGKGADIVEQAPKAFKEGPKSPVKGTKVVVVKETRGQTPLQQSTTTVGRYARETAKSVGDKAKGVAIGAIAANAVKKGTQPDHAVTDSANHTKPVK